MREIPLTRGLVALVDDEDYDWIASHRWHPKSHIRHGAPYHYATREEDKRVVWMHRAIMQPPASLQVDHIDGNGLNNTRANLRVCTASQNMWAARRRVGVSGYRGVKPAGNKWRAYVACDWRVYTIGIFDDAREAAMARDRAAIAFHGEFAVLNFPREVIAK